MHTEICHSPWPWNIKELTAASTKRGPAEDSIAIASVKRDGGAVAMIVAAFMKKGEYGTVQFVSQSIRQKNASIGGKSRVIAAKSAEI